MHVARRPALCRGARRLLLHARGPQGRRGAADPFPAAQPGNEKNCDLEYLKRGTDFMQRSVSAGKPFFLYFNHSLMHFPMIPRDEFKGKSTNGDWGDCLLMLAHDLGVLLDKVDELGVTDNAIVVYCG